MNIISLIETINNLWVLLMDFDIYSLWLHSIIINCINIPSGCINLIYACLFFFFFFLIHFMGLKRKQLLVIIQVLLFYFSESKRLWWRSVGWNRCHGEVITEKSTDPCSKSMVGWCYVSLTWLIISFLTRKDFVASVFSTNCSFNLKK